MKKNILIMLGLVFTIFNANSQCVECPGSTSPGSASSTIGAFSSANAGSSVTIGTNNTTNGEGSIAIGADAHTTNEGSTGIAIGGRIVSDGPYSMIIGTGGQPLDGKRMVNGYPESLMIGFRSTKPTIFVGTSPISFDFDKTGRVGIGDVTEPLTKLHLRADNGEPAVAFIEPFQWKTGAFASLALGSLEHGIGAEFELGLVFQSPTNYIFKKGNVGVGIDIPEYNLDVDGDINFTGQLLYKGEPISSGLWEQLGSNIVYTTGKVGIGTTNFVDNYSLYVENGIITNEVMVKDPSQWYDFVFDDDYNLMKLDDLEKYVQANKHLPDVPSEETVMTEGYSLPEMNGILLKKVEELTLYILQQQKMIEGQNKRIAALESDN